MLITIFVFAIILSLLVFVHELGHFLVAKKIGIKVEEFGFGLPPRIWGVKKGETIYSINALPIGGFVRLLGEDEVEIEEKEERQRYFFARSKKERSAVLLAGVTMNFLLAVIIISFIFTQGVLVPTEHVRIQKVLENSPAQAAGLQEGDVIVTFAAKQIKSSEQLIALTKEKAGTETPVQILRNGEKFTLTITPRVDPPVDQGPLGVAITNLEERKYPWYVSPYYGMIEAVKMSAVMVSALLQLLWRLVTFQPVTVDVLGPVGIAQATGEAVKFGYLAVLQLMGLLSLNLAIINILPIPALDGGRLLFVVLEKFVGRKIKPQAERIAHQVGMAFLLGLILLVTVNDILRLIRG